MRWVLLIALVVLLWFALHASQGNTASSDAQPDDTQPQPDDSGMPGYGSASDVADAWAEIEGFFQAGTPAQRYNNPVNLHGNWQGVVGHSPSGIAIFDSVSDGWAAAVDYVKQQASAHPGWSFLSFFGKVLGNLGGQAVNNDQGNSVAEADYVTGKLGVPDTTLLSQYVGG